MAAFGAIAAGGAASLIGGLLGSRGASKAARDQIQAAVDERNFKSEKYDDAWLNRLALFLGPDQALSIARATLGEGFDSLWGVDAADANFTTEQQRRYEELGQLLERPVISESAAAQNHWMRSASRVGGSITPEAKAEYEAERKMLWTAAGGKVGQSGRVDRDAFNAMGEGLIPQQERLGKEYTARSELELARVRRQNRSLIGEVDLWGKGQEEIIRRDTGRALDDANDETTAEAIASGLGNSSVAVNARNRNRSRFAEVQSDALTDLFDRQSDRRVAVRQYGDSRDAALSQGNLAQQYQWRAQPLQTLTALYGGTDVNPWAGENTSTLFPAASPNGSAAINMGNTLAQLGATAMTAFAGRANAPETSSMTNDQLRLNAVLQGGLPEAALWQ